MLLLSSISFMNQPVVLKAYLSRSRRIVLAVAGAFILLLTVTILIYRPPRLRAPSWSYAVFGGLFGASGLLAGLIRGRSRLTLDETGLSGYGLRGRTVPWSHIRRAWATRVWGEAYLCMALIEASDFRGLAATRKLWMHRNRQARFGDLAIHCPGYYPPPEAFAAAINAIVA